MVTPAYYRTEAARCRELAQGAKDPEIARQWRKMAQDYETLAESLEKVTVPLPPSAIHVSMQQQPVQQQQSKTEPDDRLKAPLYSSVLIPSPFPN